MDGSGLGSGLGIGMVLGCALVIWVAFGDDMDGVCVFGSCIVVVVVWGLWVVDV